MRVQPSKSRWPLSLLLVAVLVLTACGGEDTATPEDDGGQAADDGEPAGDEEAGGEGDAEDTAEAIEPVHLRLATSLPPGGSIMGIIEWYVEELEARTGGAVTTEIAYAGALLASGEIIPGLQEGRAETGLVVPAYHPDLMPLYNLAMVSVQGHNQAARSRALQRLYEENDAFRSEIEDDNGIIILGFIGNNAQTAATTSPVTSVDDLDGLRMRVPGNPAVGWQLLGAEPVFLGVEEVYESLQRGVIDGVTFPFDVHMTVGVHEVAKYFFPDLGQSGNAALGVSAEVYESLPQEVRDIMAELSGEWSDQLELLLTETDAQACDTLLESGGEVYVWTEEQQREIRERTADAMVQAWKDNAAEAGVDPAVADEVWEQYTGYVEELNDVVGYENGLRLCAERQ